MSYSPLDEVYYIKLNGPLDCAPSFKIDTAIPLPVRCESSGGEEGGGRVVSLKDITVEGVLSGILTVAAHDNRNPNLPYYKQLLLSARPSIKSELMEAAILKGKNEEWEDGDEIFRSLTALFSDDSAVLLNRALFLDERALSYRKSSLDDDADACDSEALSLYKMLMDEEDPLPDAFFNAGFFYMKSQSFSEAKGCFEAYIALTCDIPDEKLGESGIYKRERAEEVLNYIRNKGIDDEHFQKAYTLINSGHEEEGLEEIRYFIQKNPGVWNAWFLLGWGLRRLERYSEAREAFAQAIEIAKGERESGEEWRSALAAAYNEEAICLMECGSLEDAKGALLKALSIDNENAKVMSNLGFVAMKEGKTSEAKSYFLCALEYDKNDKIAKDALKSIG